MEEFVAHVLKINGQTLEIDWSEVEDSEFSINADVIDHEDGTRSLGQRHFTLSVDFKEGSDGARWV